MTKNDAIIVIIPKKVIDKCFVGTASRLSGVTFEILAQEVRCTSSYNSDFIFVLPNSFHSELVSVVEPVRK